MQLDVKKFEAEDFRFHKTPENAEGESSMQRLIWAMNTVKYQHECFERLLIDLKQSMDAVSLPHSTPIMPAADVLLPSYFNCARLNRTN